MATLLILALISMGFGLQIYNAALDDDHGAF